MIPPSDTRALPLPVTLLPAGTTMYRVHSERHDPLWFGPPPGAPPTHRFDDPAGAYHVCYLGRSIEAAFAETMLRTLPVRLLTPEALSGMSVTEIRAVRELRVVTFHGPGLARLGATAAVTTGLDYPAAQRWSRLLFEHPDAPDGIEYRCRHDDETFAVALFDRARGGIVAPAGGSSQLSADPARVSKLSARYGFGLSL